MAYFVQYIIIWVLPYAFGVTPGRMLFVSLTLLALLFGVRFIGLFDGELPDVYKHACMGVAIGVGVSFVVFLVTAKPVAG